jgi:hypothetical protein
MFGRLVVAGTLRKESAKYHCHDGGIIHRHQPYRQRPIQILIMQLA